MIGMGTTESPAKRFAGGLTPRQFLAIACLFWVYVALSNILYAYSMRTGMARMTNFSLFAAWDARLLQHVLLLHLHLLQWYSIFSFQEWKMQLMPAFLPVTFERRHPATGII